MNYRTIIHFLWKRKWLWSIIGRIFRTQGNLISG